MKPAAFAYSRPASLDEALALLDEAGEDAKLLAGGQSLLPVMSLRLANPTHLVDIGELPGLDAIEANGGLKVGALVRHATLEHSDALSGPWQMLREAASQIGHHPIRVRGTFGGSLAHADPAAELPVVALALDAELVVRSASGERRVPAGGFASGPLTTVLEPDEIVVGAEFPAAPEGLRSGFTEFHVRSGDWALASAGVAFALDADGRASHVRIALGSVGPVPSRASAAESALEGQPLSDEAIEQAGRLAAEGCDPSGDRHASAELRRELADAMVRRTLRRLREQS
jgi:carbon-monoxide dehydrogenase medium subunit/6-hydroxypseudooxynicotine dehydrogenase subunit alpha